MRIRTQEFRNRRQFFFVFEGSGEKERGRGALWRKENEEI